MNITVSTRAPPSFPRAKATPHASWHLRRIGTLCRRRCFTSLSEQFPGGGGATIPSRRGQNARCPPDGHTPAHYELRFGDLLPRNFRVVEATSDGSRKRASPFHAESPTLSRGRPAAAARCPPAPRAAIAQVLHRTPRRAAAAVRHRALRCCSPPVLRHHRHPVSEERYWTTRRRYQS